jgi:hypothetical protein
MSSLASLSLSRRSKWSARRFWYGRPCLSTWSAAMRSEAGTSAGLVLLDRGLERLDLPRVQLEQEAVVRVPRPSRTRTRVAREPLTRPSAKPLEASSRA